MLVGLSKDELLQIAALGENEEEIKRNLFGDRHSNKIGNEELVAVLINKTLNKTTELILANNKRISDQLQKKGVALSE
jgi:hypothetical protein